MVRHVLGVDSNLFDEESPHMLRIAIINLSNLPFLFRKKKKKHSISKEFPLIKKRFIILFLNCQHIVMVFFYLFF
jgi:hypothetical protein